MRDEIKNIVLIIMLEFTMVAIYIVGKKYE